jgi:uncharacterized membrane protein YccC
MVRSSAQGVSGRARVSVLRDARVGVKLALIGGVGLLVAVVVAVVGILGVGSVDQRAASLANVAGTLNNVASLRDGEGDMRVDVQHLADASGAAELHDALAAIKDSDGAVDDAVAGHA